MDIKSISPAKADALRAKRRSGSSGSVSDFSEILENAEGFPQKTVISSTSNVVSVWAAQEIESPLEKRKKAIRKGNDILETLTNLQKSLSTGDDLSTAIKHMQYLMLEKPDAGGDPKLQDILDAIHLRASVEVAKFGFYS